MTKPKHLESYRVQDGCHNCSHVHCEDGVYEQNSYFCDFDDLKGTSSYQVEENGICDNHLPIEVK